MCESSGESSAAVVAEAESSPAYQGCTARFVLDRGHATPEAATVAYDLAQRMLGQVEALFADPATDLPAPLRAALAGLADALAEQTAGRATVTALDTPLARAWRPSRRVAPVSDLGAAPTLLRTVAASTVLGVVLQR
jgi:hypothetical protein